MLTLEPLRPQRQASAEHQRWSFGRVLYARHESHHRKRQADLGRFIEPDQRCCNCHDDRGPDGNTGQQPHSRFGGDAMTEHPEPYLPAGEPADPLLADSKPYWEGSTPEVDDPAMFRLRSRSGVRNGSAIPVMASISDGKR